MYNTYFGQGAGPVSFISCTTSAQNITQCNVTTASSCTHSNDAGLRCATTCYDGQVRLVDGMNVREGRVEVCSDGNWTSVCDNLWNEAEAKVVCRQIGYLSDGECDVMQVHSHACLKYRCTCIFGSLLWPGN